MSAMMSSMGGSLGAALRQSRAEWQGNPRLRWGVRLIVATLWVWLALLAQDHAQVWRTETEEARAELERLQPLRAQAQWTQRAEAARVQLEAARAMLWPSVSQGQAEAALQDMLRELCTKAGLPVRELAVAAGAQSGADGVKPVRARLVVDMGNRLALMGVLAEIGRSPRVMMVDSLRLRPQAVPARAEIEVRVLFRPLDTGA
jgi:hypothetical protein